MVDYRCWISYDTRLSTTVHQRGREKYATAAGNGTRPCSPGTHSKEPDVYCVATSPQGKAIIAVIVGGMDLAMTGDGVIGLTISVYDAWCNRSETEFSVTLMRTWSILLYTAAAMPLLVVLL